MALEQSKSPRQLYDEHVSAFRQAFAAAIKNNHTFERQLTPSVFAGVFAVSHDLLADLNRQGRSVVFQIMPEYRGVNVLIVTPSGKEVNLVRAMHDWDYRAKLVSGWYKRLGRAGQMGNEQKAFTEVQRVLSEAQTPLGLTVIEGVNLPGMFDLEYPPQKPSSVQLHLYEMRNMLENNALNTAKNIHSGLFGFLEEFWPLIQEIAPNQIKAQSLLPPAEIRAATLGGSVHSE